MDTLELYNHSYYNKYNYYGVVSKALILSRETVPEVNIYIILEHSNNMAFRMQNQQVISFFSVMTISTNWIFIYLSVKVETLVSSLSYIALRTIICHNLSNRNETFIHYVFSIVSIPFISSKITAAL